MKKLLLLFLAVLMALSLATTATAEVEKDDIITITAADYPNIDLTEHKTVNIIVITDKPDDYDMVLAYVNERLEGEFNTTLEFTIVSWSDYQQMYPLLMASGESYDLAWMLPQLGLFNYIEKEYLVPIDMEFVETYMPYTFKYQSEESWGHVSYKGKYVGIPQGLADSGGSTDMIAVRNDILEKYGVTAVDTWEDIKSLWLAIAADTEETGMLALAECKGSAYGFNLCTQAAKYVQAGTSVDFRFIWKDGEAPSPEDIFFLYRSDTSYDALMDMKELADAGVWSRSALSNTTLNYTTFSQGAAATGCFNGSIYWYVNELKKNLGVDSTVFVIGQQSGTQMVLKENYNQNTFSFYSGSKDLPRAAMVLDILKYDTDLNHTICAGIDGYHRIEETPGIYTEGEHAAGWQMGSFCLAWNLKNGSLKALYEDEKRNAAQDWLDEVGVSNPTAAFAFDNSATLPYMTAVAAAVNEYRDALRLGLVPDMEVAYNEFQDTLDEAGLQLYFDDFVAQYTEWYNAL